MKLFGTSSVRAVCAGLLLLMSTSTAHCLNVWVSESRMRASLTDHFRRLDDSSDGGVKSGGRHYEQLEVVVELPGVNNPLIVGADEVNVPDDAEVIGLMLDGRPYAFPLLAMADPARHIVNLIVNEQPVSVTYCDQVDCVRVLTGNSTEPLRLGVGGIDVYHQMVYLYDGKRYSQQSTALPLKDLPFGRETFGSWKKVHPDTRVYLGSKFDF